MSFVEWLTFELDRRRWTKRELAQQAGVSESMVYQVLNGQRNPGFEFCVGVARAFELSPEVVLRRAGLLPPLPDEVAFERDLVRAFRQLSHQARAAILETVRSLAARVGSGSVVAEERAPYDVGPRTVQERLAYDMAEDLSRLSEEDQRRVFDLMRRLRGSSEAENNGTVEVD